MHTIYVGLYGAVGLDVAYAVACQHQIVVGSGDTDGGARDSDIGVDQASGIDL